MKIIISNDTPLDLVDFYKSVARQMNIKTTRETRYDCTKINVAANIQDKFYEHYHEIARKRDASMSESEINVGITMLLAMSGPKVDATLKANEVEIFDGFVVA